MAKEKFNIENLLPAKPAVVKSKPETAPLMEKAVETIHQVPLAKDDIKGVNTRKISCDLPADWYKFIKRYCIDQDMTMRQYLLTLIEEDLRKRQTA